MKLYNRKDLEILETNIPVRIELSNGEQYKIVESFNELVLTKIEGNISITPQYANQISIK